MVNLLQKLELYPMFLGKTCVEFELFFFFAVRRTEVFAISQQPLLGWKKCENSVETDRIHISQDPSHGKNSLEPR